MLNKVKSLFTKSPSVATPTVTTPHVAYAVILPGKPEVIIRASNMTEVRGIVRQSLGLSRLPAGTTVKRHNSGK